MPTAGAQAWTLGNVQKIDGTCWTRLAADGPRVTRPWNICGGMCTGPVHGYFLAPRCLATSMITAPGAGPKSARPSLSRQCQMIGHVSTPSVAQHPALTRLKALQGTGMIQVPAYAQAHQGIDGPSREQAAPGRAGLALVRGVQRIQQAAQELLGVALLAVAPSRLHCCSLVQKPAHRAWAVCCQLLAGCLPGAEPMLLPCKDSGCPTWPCKGEQCLHTAVVSSTSSAHQSQHPVDTSPCR